MCIRDRGISMKKVIHPSLLLAPNAALNIVCAKWQLPEESPALKKCMQLMIEVVIAMGGFGLSAPQVNIPKQVFLLTNPKLMMSDPAQSFNFFINPQLIDASHKKCSYWETCLSLQDKLYLVQRPKEMTMEYSDESGTLHRITDSGVICRGCLHELDHLNGVLISDKAKSVKKKSEIATPKTREKFIMEHKDQILEL
eukprot:TRINITY_DN14332_c0_g1_i3.p1 TRINITY_DN14332_c0_g1~~TRINITY_DN14332_c0_g1_i3.p1  ORF type:complete len:197 (-),score=26.39 TRINITY_DN14332_c0_g1_i3:109-699(-)